MTPTEISTMLQNISVNIPVFYDHANEGSKVPFIEWTLTPENNFSADNKSYKLIYSVRAVFYSITKDLTSEQLIIAALTDNNIPFSQTENYIDEEKLFQEIFTFSIIDS